ncbi:dITP/XTP pyrophosphatase [Spiroplasma corruscae]|uniref:dITP/XTP pyrophosphatase n=1 Tax=Spiroplasma corruscae TaxID=216934 RepID=A0A222EP79_9MOLU|nr:RdgB/HAM1 family non-canonical purine NTP pyrophosphatase [Spiroplasma corruscae]ASP28114.1 dITP/XTP pyrophosphatase [Spiroplasma corruscae]
MEIVLATNNQKKVDEIQKVLNNHKVLTLKDVGICVEIPEDQNTFKGNALQKALYVSNLTNYPVIADDSGLSITGLNNFPGVYSARWALPETDYDIINKLLLKKMSDHNLIDKFSRDASFICAIAFVDKIKGIKEVFEKTLKGYISNEQIGNNGFAYDKIFTLYDNNKTLAQLSFEEKNQISHRKLACDELNKYLENIK